MKKRFNTNLTFYRFLFFGIIVFISSCNNQFDDTTSDDIIVSSSEELNSFSLSELQVMKAELEKNGIELPDIDLNAEEDSMSTRGIFLENPFVRAIKVTSKTLHPNRSGDYINVSGVLLVPRKSLLTSLINFRIAIVPPPTYTYNNEAPSIAFQRMSFIHSDWSMNFMYFWVLQAQTGYVVFIPDYPGFGDSLGECMHPYLDAKALVNSTLDLFKSAQKTLSANGYRYKKDIIISGYSQGAFVAASLAREIETNPTHGITVSLLVTGGTPCDLKYITDVVRHSTYVRHSHFLPYGLWGYKENAYPNLNPADFLLEPYASISNSYYDGTHGDVNSYFSHVPAEVYTEKFIKDLDINPSLAYMNRILDENSVKPWKNKCKFIMTHGIADESVYYQNAKNFADEQNKTGQVSFYPTIGDHVIGFVPYFLKASSFLYMYK